MTGLNHVLTGAAIGLAIKQPLLVAPIALMSHFVLDAIPHFDHEVYRWGSRWFLTIMIADGLITISMVLILMSLAPEFIPSIVTGSIFAILPDSTLLYYYNRGRPRHHWLFRFHIGIQWYERPPGLLVEASYLIFIGTVLWALLQGGV